MRNGQIVVVQACDGLAGSYAGRTLGEAGARIVYVQEAEEGPWSDMIRVVNFGKEVLTRRELSQTSDMLRQACATADVFITDWSEGRLQRYSAGRDTLRKLNAGLVYCRLTNEGIECNEDRAIDELVLGATSGLYAAQFGRTAGPVFTIQPQASLGAGILAAAASTAALLERAQTGRAPCVDVPLITGAFAIQASMLNVATDTGRMATDVSGDPQGISPAYHAYRCADEQWIFIVCAHMKHWTKFCLVLGHDDVLADERFEDAPWGIPAEYRAELLTVFADAISLRPSSEWIATLRDLDIPCARIVERHRLMGEPHLAAKIETCAAPGTAQVRLTSRPVRIDAIELLDTLMRSEEVPTTARQPLTPSNERLVPPVQGLPLSGLTVLDLSSFMAAGVTCSMLAGLGATVIKVELPDGDPMRSLGFAFFGVNYATPKICIDYTTPDGLALLKTLIRDADVLVENFRPSKRKRLGLTNEEVFRENPRLVHCSITAFGQGVLWDLAGVDAMGQAMSGMMTTQGGPGHPPVVLESGPCDHAAALNACFGILFALLLGKDTKCGYDVDTSLLDAGLELQLPFNALGFPARVPADTGEDRSGLSALNRLYSAQDGWLALDARATELHTLMSVLGLQGAVEIDVDSIADVNGALSGSIQAAVANEPRQTWIQRLSGAGIRAVAVRTRNELVQDPIITANKWMVSQRSEWGDLWRVGPIIRLDGVAHIPTVYPTELGSMTREILTRTGLSDEDIKALQARNIVVAT